VKKERKKNEPNMDANINIGECQANVWRMTARCLVVNFTKGAKWKEVWRTADFFGFLFLIYFSLECYHLNVVCLSLLALRAQFCPNMRLSAVLDGI
jgi:hypothetical protein